jgi:hypothetical protein
MMNQNPVSVVRFLCLIVVLMYGNNVLADPKTDVVILKNGDRITGELKGFNRGILLFKTDDAGTLQIEWHAIKELKSKYHFIFYGTEGERYYGQIGATDKPETLLIQRNGEALVEMPLSELVRFDRVKETFWKQVDAYIGIGLSANKASEVAQLNLDAGVSWKGVKDQVSLDMTSITTRQRTGADQRGDLTLAYTHDHAGNMFSGVYGILSRNEAMGIAAQEVLTYALGNRFLQTPVSHLTLAAGVDALAEQAFDSDETTQGVEGALLLGYDIYSFADKEKDLKYVLLTYSGISYNRMRVNSNLDLTYELIGDIDLVTTLYYNYDSSPPTSAVTDRDYGINLSFRWSK